ncbi:MFS transporter [Bacillus sp. SM2101]|uniref:MFS transporter n=1 Tax=Bacillus sp. SM2101 TaxID=2805366 RepID=UPI001BDF4BBD|nr:MFS transporter [Bacillus sp. SM2101]
MKPVHKRIILLDFLFGLSRGAIIPFLVLDMKIRLNVNYSEITGSILLYFIARTFGGLIGGALSDRFGRKPLMLIGLFVTSLSYLLLPFVTSLIQFFAIYIILGFAHSLFRGVFAALIGDTIDKTDPTTPFALFHINQNISVGIGAVLGGVLVTYNSVFIYIFTGVLLLCFSLIATFNPYLKDDIRRAKISTESNTEDIEEEKPNYIPLLTGVFLLNIVLVLSYGVYNELLGAIFVDFVKLSPITIGYLFAFNSLLIVFFQMFVIKHVSKWRFISQMSVTAFMFACFFFLLSILPSYPSIWLCIILIIIFTTGELTHIANLNSKVNEFTPSNKKGIIFGILNATFNIGFGLGPFFFSLFLDNYTLILAGGIFGVLYAVISLGLCLYLFRRKKQESITVSTNV